MHPIQKIKYLLVLSLCFCIAELSAQLYSGQVRYAMRDYPATLDIKTDSSLCLIIYDRRENFYARYEGRLVEHGKHFYVLRFNQAVHQKYWDVFPNQHTDALPPGYLYIDSTLKNNFSPATVIYSNGKKQRYPYKGRMFLDSLFLSSKNGKNEYHLTLGKKNWFGKKPIYLRGYYGLPMVLQRDAKKTAVLIRFKNDSLLSSYTPGAELELRMKRLSRERSSQQKKPHTAEASKLPIYTEPLAKGDSLVWEQIFEPNSGLDAPSEIQFFHYKNGKVQSETVLYYQDNILSGRSNSEFVYDDSGRLRSIIQQAESYQQCDSLSFRPYFRPYDPSRETIEPDTIYYSCPEHRTSVTNFYDSLMVKETKILHRLWGDLDHSRRSSHVIDSVLYHTNGFKKREVGYNVDEHQFYSRVFYRYEYRKDGRLSEKTLTFHNQHGRYMVQRFVCRGSDTLLVYSTEHRFSPDSAVGEYTRVLVDTTTGITSLRSYYNAKLNWTTLLVPTAVGMKTYSYNSDSTRHEESFQYRDTSKQREILRQKVSPGKLEVWRFTNKRSLYQLSDTVRTLQGIEIREYESDYEQAPETLQSLPVNACKLLRVHECDKNGLWLQTRTFEERSGKRIRLKHYRYRSAVSKN